MKEIARKDNFRIVQKDSDNFELQGQRIMFFFREQYEDIEGALRLDDYYFMSQILKAKRKYDKIKKVDN